MFYQTKVNLQILPMKIWVKCWENSWLLKRRLISSDGNFRGNSKLKSFLEKSNYKTNALTQWTKDAKIKLVHFTSTFRKAKPFLCWFKRVEDIGLVEENFVQSAFLQGLEQSDSLNSSGQWWLCWNVQWNIWMVPFQNFGQVVQCLEPLQQ